MSTEVNAAAQEVKEPVTLTISGVKEDLAAGLTREQIQEKYTLSWSQLKQVFEHPKLKGLKTHRAIDPSVVLVDDDPEGAIYTAKPRKPRGEGAKAKSKAAIQTAAASVATPDLQEGTAIAANSIPPTTATVSEPPTEEPPVVEGKKEGMW